MSELIDQMTANRRIVGPARAQKWVPLIWLPWFLFFLLAPLLEHASTLRWLETAAGGIVFLVFYFGMFWSRRWRWYCIVGMVALGLLFAPINGGASCFFIYPAAFCPFLVNTEVKALKIIVLIVGLVGFETWLLHSSSLHLSWWFFIYCGAFAGIIGMGNIFFAQRNRANEKLRMAHQEIEQLAKVAERERIARDMHDILGHTLSVIILKSELAGKLIDLDPERAKNEIRDVEQTSRQALGDVRNAIRGYRELSLSAELKQAKATLETAGVRVESDAAEIRLTPAQESVVALVVREAVTNVVRHSQAHTCSLRLAPLHDQCWLEIRDDGCGSNGIEGNGLRGMRERIEALGGTLERETGRGTTLTIQFPLVPAEAGDIQ